MMALIIAYVAVTAVLGGVLAARLMKSYDELPTSLHSDRESYRRVVGFAVFLWAVFGWIIVPLYVVAEAAILFFGWLGRQATNL